MKPSLATSLLVLLYCPFLLASSVILMPTPNGGIQPQAAIDGNGTLHLVYFQGKPEQGNLFYVRRKNGDEAFSTPLRVNHIDESAMAIGTIRGAQMSIGQNGRIHVTWMGSNQVAVKTEADEYPQHPMLYTRLIGSAFEPERNVVQWTKGIDGGGSVAADSLGHVYVAWHGSQPGNKDGEMDRAMYLAWSNDGGATFLREKQANPEPTGSCACCGMRAYVDKDNRLQLLYRTANTNSRDMMLLTSTDNGKTFSSTVLNKWFTQACPMSSAAMTSGNGSLLLATERDGKVEMSAMDYLGQKDLQIRAVSPEKAKHPSVATNQYGEILVAWAEGAMWANPGRLNWWKDGEVRVEEFEMKAWSFPTAVALAEGDFLIIY